MNIKADARIDGYLARVRVALRGMPGPEIDDILRELRSHVDDLAGADGAGVEAALMSLGDPIDLAKTYRTENLLTRAECAGSPLMILQGLRHASPSRWVRVLVTALYVLGYAYVVALISAAVHMVFSPSTTSRQWLGWWLLPAFIVLALALRYVTDRTAQWWIRRYRHSRTGLST